MSFVSLFGESLVNNKGEEVKVSELSTKKGSVIGLYFSAHWCPPCRAFTPQLAKIYNEIRDSGKDFEVIFISSDSSEKDFKDYHKDMPWLAIPYNNEDEKEACSEKYSIQGLPTLVLIDGENGETITEEGRGAVGEFGADGFPFTDTRLEECKKEQHEKKSKALASLGGLEFIGPLSKIDKSDAEVDIKKVADSCDSLVLAFMAGSNDRGSSLVLPKLLDCQKSLGNTKLGLVLIPLAKLDEFGEDLKSKLGETPMVQPGEEVEKIVQKLKDVAPEIEAPYVIVLEKNIDGTFKLQADDAARDIFVTGDAGFPWSVEALAALKEREEAAKEELKSKQKNLEFLSTNDGSVVVDKKGETVPITKLQSADVVGLYFSAHWCGPCRGFTPQLAKLYNECKEKGKNFEIVFVSSDRNEEAFKEYFEEMPWCALSFKERTLKNNLSELYEVQGIPTLVLLTGKGELITKDGRAAIGEGVDAFPWNKNE